MAVQAVRPIPTALPNADLAVERYGGFGQQWLDGMWRGDPLADAVVADGARLVRRAIAEGVEAVADAPEPLVALFAELDRTASSTCSMPTSGSRFQEWRRRRRSSRT